MKQPLLERLVWRFCDFIGHKFDKRDLGWLHDGKHFRTCARCRRITSKDLT